MVLVILFFLCLGLVAWFDLTHYLLLFKFYLRKHRSWFEPKTDLAYRFMLQKVKIFRFEDYPLIAVQVPVYNDAACLAKTIDSICASIWPKNKLHIQLLDDSDSVNHAFWVDRVCHVARSRGYQADVIRRTHREGFKAGALQNALQFTSAHYVVVLDSDFIISPWWMRDTFAELMAGGGTGMVQTRWTYRNRSENAITKVAALLLDSHFIIEKTVRSSDNSLVNFNGSGGMWLRKCIESSGGWRGDTLSEDTDLSYRAQMCGWTFRYVPNITCSSELPITYGAFWRQQQRWHNGGTAAGRRGLLALLRRSDTDVDWFWTILKHFPVFVFNTLGWGINTIGRIALLVLSGLMSVHGHIAWGAIGTYFSWVYMALMPYFMCVDIEEQKISKREDEKGGSGSYELPWWGLTMLFTNSVGVLTAAFKIKRDFVVTPKVGR